jgi:hypothetical protein
MHVCLLLDEMLEYIFNYDDAPLPGDVPSLVIDKDIAAELKSILDGWKRRWKKERPFSVRKLEAVARAYRRWHPRYPMCSMFFLISQRKAFRLGLSSVLPSLGYKKRIIAVHGRYKWYWMKPIALTLSWEVADESQTL